MHRGLSIMSSVVVSSEKRYSSRDEFLRRLGIIVKDTATPLYAFALVPNHFHLLVRRGASPISKVMRRLLTGYALYFNKKHNRAGYLFQNRYKATICQEEPYFLELIRYIHLNPIRAGIVAGLHNLKEYPFSGHGLILGTGKADWFDDEYTLSHFASGKKRATDAYLRFIESGLAVKQDLSGGGLKRSLGEDVNHQRQPQFFDDRVLGEGMFVEQLLAAEEHPLTKTKIPATDVIATVAARHHVSEAQLLSRSKERRVAKARAELAYRLSVELGLTGVDIGRMLSMGRSAVSKMIARAASVGNRG